MNSKCTIWIKISFETPFVKIICYIIKQVATKTLRLPLESLKRNIEACLEFFDSIVQRVTDGPGSLDWTARTRRSVFLSTGINYKKGEAVCIGMHHVSQFG